MRYPKMFAPDTFVPGAIGGDKFVFDDLIRRAEMVTVLRDIERRSQAARNYNAAMRARTFGKRSLERIALGGMKKFPLPAYISLPLRYADVALDIAQYAVGFWEESQFPNDIPLPVSGVEPDDVWRRWKALNAQTPTHWSNVNYRVTLGVSINNNINNQYIGAGTPLVFVEQSDRRLVAALNSQIAATTYGLWNWPEAPDEPEADHSVSYQRRSNANNELGNTPDELLDNEIIIHPDRFVALPTRPVWKPAFNSEPAYRSYHDGWKVVPPPPPPPLPRPPSKNTNERKVTLTQMMGFIAPLLNLVTESLDMLDVAHDALPRHLQARPWWDGTRWRAATPQMKADAVYRNWQQMDVDKFIIGFIKNQTEDYIFGRIGGELASQSLIHHAPHGWQIGPAL